MAISNSLLSLVETTFKDKAKISKITTDLRGKIITIYGYNNLGKTYQASKFKNPVFIPFEEGLNGISGAIVLKANKWSDFTGHLKTLSGRKWAKIVEQEQVTIICDGMETMGRWCRDYITEKFGSSSIKTGNAGYGLWQEYQDEMFNQVNKLLKLGFTVVFLGHEKFDKDKNKFIIEGDERNIAPMRNNSDYVVYLKSNGVDKDGNPINSSGYLAETDDFFARSRNIYTESFIEDFTAENLEKVIIAGLIKEKEMSGQKDDIDYKVQREIYEGEEPTHEELKEAIGELFAKFEGLDKLEEYADIVAEHLGEDIAVSETTKKHLQQLMRIQQDLEELLEKLEEE
ncbi:MAG: AAA family ATPase [Tissierellia bacterium]|nr:AAA family ATPase [Tissierellia bacterium]